MIIFHQGEFLACESEKWFLPLAIRISRNDDELRIEKCSDILELRCYGTTMDD